MSRWLTRKAIDMGQVDVEQENKINQALNKPETPIVETQTITQRCREFENLIQSKNIFDVDYARDLLTNDYFDYTECLNYIKDIANQLEKDPEIQAYGITNNKLLDMFTNKKIAVKDALIEILYRDSDSLEYHTQVTLAQMKDALTEINVTENLSSMLIGILIIILIGFVVAVFRKD